MGTVCLNVVSLANQKWFLSPELNFFVDSVPTNKTSKKSM